MDISVRIETNNGISRYSPSRCFLNDRTFGKQGSKEERQTDPDKDRRDSYAFRRDEHTERHTVDKDIQMETRTDRRREKQRGLPDRLTAIG